MACEDDSQLDAESIRITAEDRFDGAHRIDVFFEHGQWFVQVDDDADEPTKSYSVVQVEDIAGNPRGYDNSGIDFEEL